MVDVFPPHALTLFSFRFETLEGGGVRVWVDAGGGQSGPITLCADEADAVGELFERVVRMLRDAAERENPGSSTTGRTSPTTRTASAERQGGSSEDSPERPTSRAPSVQLPRKPRSN